LLAVLKEDGLMPRKYKGIERRIRYGLRCPRLETMIKTVERKTSKAVHTAGRKYGHTSKAQGG